MDERPSQTDPRRAARQVWGLAGLGLLGGVVTLIIFGMALLKIRDDREEADLFTSETASFIAVSESRVAEGRNTMIAMLAPDDRDVPRSNWLSAVRSLVDKTGEQARSPLVAEDLRELGRQLEEIEEIERACIDWRADRRFATEQRTRTRAQADATLNAIRDAIILAEGRQRLRRVVKIRQYRGTEGDAAQALADEIIGDVASTAGVGTIRSELADLALLCERLAHQENLDGLVDLKDNQVTASLARMRRELVKFMGRDESLPIDETSLAAFERALFGAGFVNDTQHQTIVPGTGGLYMACTEVLELEPVRVGLSAAVTDAFGAVRSIQHDLEEKAQARGQEIAEQSERLLRRGLILIVVIGLGISLVFVFLAARIAGQIRDQVRRLAESDLESRLVHGTAEMAAETDSFQEALQHVVDLVCELTEWPVGHAYEPDPLDPGILRPTRLWHVADAERFSRFREITEQTSFRCGEGLPGRILQDQSPAWISDVGTDPNSPRNRVASDLGVRGAFGFPVSIGGEVVAVLEFFSERQLEPDERLLPMMRNVADQLSRVFERRRAADELERARIAAEAANRAKSEFLSNMSHELRTPLNGVLGYAQILRRDPASTPAQREALDSIENCGQHLLTLINDVLDLSKIDAGRLEIVTEATDLHRLLKSVLDIIRPRGEEKGLEVALRVSPEVPIGIVTDGTKLKQTLINLLSNAVKFTDEGSVTLDVRDAGEEILEFTVADTGIGMTPEELGDIFDPFKQAEGGKVAGGTGLGLAISKRIIEAQGGALIVESVKGEGSRFTIRIPLLEASDKEMTAVQEETLLEKNLPVLEPGQDVSILVVDDRPANRDILVQLLESAGFKTMQAEDGRIALDRLAEQRVPLVLMDVRMPVMNGIEATKAIRDDEHLKDIKVIAVTASVFPDFKQRIAEAGFDDFVGKPFRAGEIFARIERHLGVRFEETEAAAAPETADADAGPDPGGVAPDVAGEIARRLRVALKVKNVTALNALAAELNGGAGPEANVGARIAGLARSFDFNGLGALADQMEAAATTAS